MLAHTLNSKFSSHYPVPDLGTYKQCVLWEEEGERQQRTHDSLDISYLSWKEEKGREDKMERP